MTEIPPYEASVDGVAEEPRTLELLSVVAPVYNEEALLEDFYGRVCGALGRPIGTGRPPCSLAQSGGSREDPDIRLLVMEREVAARRAHRASPDAAPSDAAVAGEK